MTFIVVPHGGRDLSTRSFEISYRRLRTVGILLVLAVVLWLAMAASWFYLAAQAARVPLLQGEVAELREQQAQMAELAEALRRVEARYEQMREMLGAGRSADEGSVWLPPAPEGGERNEARPAPATEEPDSVQAFLPAAWPLAQRGFVTRGHLEPRQGQHPGIDVAVAEGSPVRAVAGGIVEAAGDDRVYGKFVRIRHGDGYQSLYAHASTLLVEPHDSVRRFQVIARSGNTGVSTAPHLHFEIWKDGRAVDPRVLVTEPGQGSSTRGEERDLLLHARASSSGTSP